MPSMPSGAASDAASDAAGGRILGDEIRVLGLEPLELLHQGVEFGVRDLRVVQDVIALFVITDEQAELGNPVSRRHARYRSRERT